MPRIVSFKRLAIGAVVTYLMVHVFVSPPTRSDLKTLLNVEGAPSGPKLEALESLAPWDFEQRGLLDKWRQQKSNLFVATGTDWKRLSETRQVFECFISIFRS